MKTSAEILDILRSDIQKSGRKIEILKADESKASAIKGRWDAPDSSLFGTVTRATGGIVIENWVRLLGAGERDIATWNERLGLRSEITVVADDIAGGLFAYGVDGTHIIHYFAPDTLEWEHMDITYNQLVQWLIEGDLDMFYENVRWNGWQKDIAALKFTEGVSFYPFLWTATDEARQRKVMPLQEIIKFAFDMKERTK